MLRSWHHETCHVTWLLPLVMLTLTSAWVTLSPAPWETPWSSHWRVSTCGHPHEAPTLATQTRGATLGLIQTTVRNTTKQDECQTPQTDNWLVMLQQTFWRIEEHLDSRTHTYIVHCTLSLPIECVPPWPETTLSCSAPSSPSVGALCFVSLKINSNITSLATTTTAQPRTPSQNVKWRIVRSYTNERDDEWTHCYFHCIVLLQMIMKCTYFENDALSPV